ncbi:PQQ-binding-like beta-propeller repeat protein [Thermococcus aggregans]|uniref:PQQ-binding-like beta-propeller repeat protein n=1 Tax=Thermococcus aggregans TaxID=110163 RepID=A0A9E7MW52_THEAG|nr:PQQ-binding-like beta-propeller repeat protein [Thermococcus aggregans]USS39990.1 PQQ-binding-like beta-propeller repeat protein [Thermococcus aggregans]
MSKKIRILLNILFIFLIFWTLNYWEETSKRDPLLDRIYRLDLSLEWDVDGIGFQNDTLVVKVTYHGLSRNPKNGSLLFIRDGKIVRNVTLLPFDDFGTFDLSKDVIALGTYSIKWLDESTFTFSPFYLIAYSPTGSELWRKEFNVTSLSTAGDLIVARGYVRNGSVVKVFDVRGNELWGLAFGENVATNGKTIAVTEKGKIYLFSREGNLIKTIEPWKGTVGSVELTDDGRLVVTFYSKEGSYLGVYSENGSLLWTKNFSRIRDFAISQNYILVYDGALHILDWSGKVLWDNTRYYPLYPEVGIALGRIAISGDEKFIAYGSSEVSLAINPLFDHDKDGIIDEDDPIPFNNGIFYRALLTIVVGIAAIWVNRRELQKSREEARKKYEEIKNSLDSKL